MNEEAISSETGGDKNYTAGPTPLSGTCADRSLARFPKLLFTLGSRAPLIIATNTPTNRNLAARYQFLVNYSVSLETSSLSASPLYFFPAVSIKYV